uniref:Fe-S cluster protein n=1 Tax=Desulfobacca acetoxidans TaxID=60893 RepID=A0A7C3SJE8_9BACT
MAPESYKRAERLSPESSGDLKEIPMLLEKIDKYEIFRPKCDSTKEVLHCIATFDADISPVLPYLNAELGGWDYDQRNQVLLLKLSAGKWITLHPHQIAIRGARDIEEAEALLKWIQGQINDIYERREQIEPRYTSQAGLKVMEILKLLPMTNCKACGYPTCMAYAAALREGETRLQDCPPLWEEKFKEKREKLQAYLESFGWRALDAA